jgi:uncharacterized membrane protein YtjA (UPF0391 family)
MGIPLLKTSYCRLGNASAKRKFPRNKAMSSVAFQEPYFAGGVLLAKLEGTRKMLGWALTFLILALVAGFFGFFGLAGLSAGVAKILLFAFIVLFLISALSGALRGRAPPI